MRDTVSDSTVIAFSLSADNSISRRSQQQPMTIACAVLLDRLDAMALLFLGGSMQGEVGMVQTVAEDRCRGGLPARRPVLQGLVCRTTPLISF